MKKISLLLLSGTLLFPVIAGAQTFSAYYNIESDVQYSGIQRRATNAYYQNLMTAKTNVFYVSGSFGTVQQGENPITFFVIPLSENSRVYNVGSEVNITKTLADKNSGVTFASVVKGQPIIEVGFDTSGKSGKIDEVVTVYADWGTYYLRLRGFVKK